MSWNELETSTHQDHIIKHVIGATVLGWFVAGEAAHFLLDIGFVWTVYPDSEMNLVLHGVGIAELEADNLTGVARKELAADADKLLQHGRDVEGLKRFTAAPVECLIDSVEVFGLDDRRLLVVNGDSGRLTIETSIESGEISIAAS